jgi:hypothetical protein
LKRRGKDENEFSRMSSEWSDILSIHDEVEDGIRKETVEAYSRYHTDSILTGVKKTLEIHKWERHQLQ